MVFGGSGSFILQNSRAGVASVRKGITGVQGRVGRGNLMTCRRRVSVGGELLERADHQAE